jgi:hypothetical protein
MVGGIVRIARFPSNPSRAARLAPPLTAVLSTLWFFRWSFVDRSLPGDIGDARWTTAITEHWYRFWTGAEALRDVTSYFPEHGTLGTSDAFFFQGQIHAVARVLGAGMVEAWLIAQVVTFLVGALGVAALSMVILRDTWSRVAFVALTCLSYPVLAQTGHVQTYAYLSVSWLFVGLAAIHRGTSARGVRGGLVLLAVVPPTLALTSYYALVLGMMLVASLGVFGALLTPRRQLETTIRRDCERVWAALRTPVGVAAAVVGLLLWAFAVWIYLPARGLLPDPTWAEVTPYAPRWSDLLNASGGGGGIWGPLYDSVFSGPVDFERTLGFTPALFVSFLAVGLHMVRSIALRSEREPLDPGLPGRRGLIAAWFAVFAVLFTLLIDEQGLGLFKLLWDHVPGFEAIRAPFRAQLLLYPVATFVVVRGVEMAARGWSARNAPTRQGAATARWATALGGLLALALFVEMQRPAEFWWTPEQLLDSSLRAQAQEVEERCDAFIVTDLPTATDPDQKVRVGPVWVRTIDAVVLSALTGVPTPQGYGRAAPVGHPWVEGDAPSLVRWMRSEGFEGSVCTVSRTGVDVEP